MPEGEGFAGLRGLELEARRERERGYYSDAAIEKSRQLLEVDTTHLEALNHLVRVLTDRCRCSADSGDLDRARALNRLARERHPENELARKLETELDPLRYVDGYGVVKLECKWDEARRSFWLLHYYTSASPAAWPEARLLKAFKRNQANAVAWVVTALPDEIANRVEQFGQWLDDILTSGATSQACRDRLLRHTSCPAVLGVFVGRTVRRDDPPWAAFWPR